MVSTTLIGVKLLASFIVGVKSNPGYLEKEEGKEFEYLNLLQTVPHDKLCHECKLIKTPRSVHCSICNRCVDRYEGHCVWLNNCVGRGNANTYFIWVFYVWLDVFLVGWISMASIRVVACEIDHCIYAFLCIACNNHYVHYTTTWGCMIICYFYFVPSAYWCCKQCINYGKGMTTNERYARANRTASAVSEDDVNSLYEDITENGESEALIDGERPRRRRRRGCWGNCGQMCCNKKIMTQRELLQMHMAESALDTSTVHTNE